MSRNAYQKAAIEAYPDGEIIAEDDNEADGDGLLKFVLVELSTKEGCENREEAIRRMNTAINELEGVRDGLENLPAEE